MFLLASVLVCFQHDLMFYFDFHMKTIFFHPLNSIQYHHNDCTPPPSKLPFAGFVYIERINFITCQFVKQIPNEIKVNSFNHFIFWFYVLVRILLHVQKCFSSATCSVLFSLSIAATRVRGAFSPRLAKKSSGQITHNYLTNKPNKTKNNRTKPKRDSSRGVSNRSVQFSFSSRTVQCSKTNVL